MSRWIVVKPVASLRPGPLVLVAAAALAISQATAVGAPLHPAASTSAPVIVEQGSSESGYPIVGSGPSGVAIRFIDHGTFWIAVALRNRSTHAVTVARADTVEPPGSLVQETGAVFARYHPCTGRQPCPFPAPSLPGSTAPLTLQPGQMAAVKLKYRLVTCTEALHSTTASATDLTVAYRIGNGAERVANVPLGSATLRLRKPAGVECVPRPFSHLGLVGSFTTSPGHQPIPGSDGDTCTRTTAGLTFRSRLFLDRSGVEFRISIDLGHYRGPGRYEPANRPGGLGPADVTATGGFGLHGWTTFHDTGSTVDVTTAAGSSLTGHLDAVFSGRRRFFHAYGTWRCTVLG